MVLRDFNCFNTAARGFRMRSSKACDECHASLVRDADDVYDDVQMSVHNYSVLVLTIHTGRCIFGTSGQFTCVCARVPITNARRSVRLTFTLLYPIILCIKA